MLFLQMMVKLRQQTNTITAYMNKTASPPKLTPNFVRWKKIAPAIKPNPIKAPNSVVRGIKISIDATSSATPVPILPHGSMPSIVNNSTDSGFAVNLKYKVCSRMTAATIFKSQIKIVLIICCILNAIVGKLFKGFCLLYDTKTNLPCFI